MTNPNLPQEPAYSAQTPYTGSGVKPKQTLSLTSFILGIASFFLSAVPFLGFLLAVGAIVTGFMAMSREKTAPAWMRIVGLVLGFLGLIGALIFTGLFIAAIVLSAQNPTY